MTRLSAVSVELLEVLSLALELPPSALHDRETSPARSPPDRPRVLLRIVTVSLARRR